MMAEPEPYGADIESMATCHCAAHRARKCSSAASQAASTTSAHTTSRTTIHQALSVVVQVGGAVYVIYNNGGGTGLKYGFQSVDNIQTAQ
jgi:hypothetical protein